MSGRFDVVVSAGTMRSDSAAAVGFPHRWTAEGVTVETEFTGAHLLHLAAAGCVLNDIYREAEALDIKVDGVRVRASGDFDITTWQSTGVTYSVDIATEASPDSVRQLLATVDDVAEIPRALRAGAAVARET
jgi:hypothetical protein